MERGGLQWEKDAYAAGGGCVVVPALFTGHPFSAMERKNYGGEMG